MMHIVTYYFVVLLRAAPQSLQHLIPKPFDSIRCVLISSLQFAKGHRDMIYKLQVAAIL